MALVTERDVRVDVEEMPLERVAYASRRQAEGAGKLVLVP